MAKIKSQLQPTASFKDKIERSLDETRVVLPGTQAFLGFQLVSVFSSEFNKLPQSDKSIHLISLIAIIISIIILMATAAYHPIAQKSQDTNRVYHFSSMTIITGMIFALFGMVGDIYIITRFITQSTTMASICTSFILLIALVLWYIYPFWIRKNSYFSD